MPVTVDPYRKKIMVDFHMLLDTDLGSAIYLKDHVKNVNYFQDHIAKVNIFYLQYMALTRKEENPIEYMFQDRYKGNADNIYGELMANKWDKVLDHSPTTEILKVIYSGYKKNGFKVTINCRNEAESDRTKLICRDWHTLIDIKDVSPYSSIFLHDIVSIDRNKYNVVGKTVYLYNYSKNHPNDEMKDNYNEVHQDAIKWSGKTIFKFISPYAAFKMPIG